MSNALNRLFKAQSIAIIGASNNPAKRGNQAIRKLLADGYEGAIYPINPKVDEIMQLKAYASVLDVASDIDVALICTPAKSLPSVLARSQADLARVSDELGGTPMAMKIVSQDIFHKSDAGGKLKISGETALRKAYGEIIANARAYDPKADVHGVLVAPMAQSGVETIIGVVHDPMFGPVMMFGLGGIFVEVLKDVSFRALPMSRADAHEMVEEIQSSKILDGLRGALPVDKAALKDLMMKVSQLALAHPEIKKIDLNPVILRNDGYDVVDARMILNSKGH